MSCRHLIYEQVTLKTVSFDVSMVCRAQYRAELRMTYKLNKDQTFLSILPLLHVVAFQ